MKESEIRSAEAHARYLEMVRADAETYFGSAGNLEAADCPACGANRFQFEFSKFGFDYGKCESCRTLYVNPRPRVGPLRDFYVESPSSRFWTEKFFKPVAEARREKIFQPRARYVSETLSDFAGAAVGDVGAGYGLFLEELRRLWPKADLTAIEPSGEMAAICRGKGLRVEECTIEDLRGRDGQFALLTAFELIEHLHTPATLIRQAFRLLRPGGCLIVTTLNGEGFDILLLWERSRGVFPPHHLNFFNPESLSRLCREAGFAVKAVETPGVLDWQIIEGTLERKEAPLDRFWQHLHRHGSAKAKSELQQWIAKHRLSSHLRIVAQKPTT